MYSKNVNSGTIGTDGETGRSSILDPFFSSNGSY